MHKDKKIGKIIFHFNDHEEAITCKDAMPKNINANTFIRTIRRYQQKKVEDIISCTVLFPDNFFSKLN